MKTLGQEIAEFILWLTPAGEVKFKAAEKDMFIRHAGKWARKLNKRIIQGQRDYEKLLRS